MLHTPKRASSCSTLAALNLGTLGTAPTVFSQRWGPSIKAKVSKEADPSVRGLNSGLPSRGSTAGEGL